MRFPFPVLVVVLTSACAVVPAQDRQRPGVQAEAEEVVEVEPAKPSATDRLASVQLGRVTFRNLSVSDAVAGLRVHADKVGVALNVDRFAFPPPPADSRVSYNGAGMDVMDVLQYIAARCRGRLVDTGDGMLLTARERAEMLEVHWAKLDDLEAATEGPAAEHLKALREAEVEGVSMRNAVLADVVRAIGSKTGSPVPVRFSDKIDPKRRLDLEVKRASLLETIRLIVALAGFDYQVDDVGVTIVPFAP